MLLWNNYRAFYLSAKDFSPFSMDFDYEEDILKKRKTGTWLEFMFFIVRRQYGHRHTVLKTRVRH